MTTADTRSTPVFEQAPANVADLTGSWLTKPPADTPPRVAPDREPAPPTPTPAASAGAAPAAGKARRKPRTESPASADKPPVRGRKMTNFLLPEFMATWVKKEAAARRVGMGDILIEALEIYDAEIAERIGHRPTIGGKRFTARTVRSTTPDFAHEPKRNVTMRFGLDDWDTLSAIGREMNAESLVQLVRTALAVCMEHDPTTKGDRQ